MKNIKKILSVLLAMIMMISIIPMSSITASAATSGTCGENLTWNFDESTGTLTISGTGEMDDYDDGYDHRERPWEDIRDDIKSVVIEYGVITVGSYALSGCGNITDITIPESVDTICWRAFSGCWSLDNIVISEGVEVIESEAFASCIGLTEVTIPASVSSIELWAFDNCKSLEKFHVDKNNLFFSTDEYGVLFNKDKSCLLQYPRENTIASYTVPDSVTHINDDCFYGCKNITTVVIGSGVTNIGNYAFSGCENLVNITLPDSLLWIGADAFMGTAFYNNEENWQDGVLYNGNVLLASNEDLAGDYEIKDGTTILADGALSGTQITSVLIPDTVKSIGTSAFFGCKELVNLIIPKSVIKIGSAVIEDCDKLTEINYLGTEYEWNEIDVGSYNNDLFNITIHFTERALKGDADCDGKITNADLELVLLHLCGINRIKSEYAADVNNAEGINSFDAQLISLYLAGEITDFNVFPQEQETEIKEIAVVFDKDSVLNAGEKLTATINIPDNSGFATLYFSLIFENSKLAVSSINRQNVFQQDVCSESYSDWGGHINFIGVSNCGVENAKTVFTVEFEALTNISCVSDLVFRTWSEATNADLGYAHTKTTMYWDALDVPDTDHAHTFGEWVTDGNTKYRICTTCDIVESQIATESGNIEIESEDQPGYKFTAEAIEENDDGYVVIEESVGDNGYIIGAFDINLMDADGNCVQPDGNVKVKIPVEFIATGTIYKVYRVNEDGSYEEMPTYTECDYDAEDFYVVFETDHFSTYVVVQEYNWEPFVILDPWTTTIRYKDGIRLRARVSVDATLPEGWHVKWVCSNDNFKVTETNGGEDAEPGLFNDLIIVSDKNGYTEFTAILYDGDGNILTTSETIEMRSKAGFFDKIGGFFRSLFGSTKIYDY